MAGRPTKLTPKLLEKLVEVSRGNLGLAVRTTRLNHLATRLQQPALHQHLAFFEAEVELANALGLIAQCCLLDVGLGI